MSQLFAGGGHSTGVSALPLFYSVFYLLAFGFCWLCWVFSSCGEQGLRSVAVRWFSRHWLLSLRTRGSGPGASSSCGTRAREFQLKGPSVSSVAVGHGPSGSEACGTFEPGIDKGAKVTVIQELKSWTLVLLGFTV